MFDTLIFDVDGTLIDTEYVYVHSLQQTLHDEKKLTVPASDLLFILGIPGMTALQRFTSDPAEQKRLFDIWVGHAAELKHHAQVYPRVWETLTALKNRGVHLALATAKIKLEMDQELDRFALHGLFDAIITADMTTTHKPDPAPLQAALAHFPKGAQALYIGDAAPDLAAAHAAGLPFALAEWGAHDDGQFTTADYRLASPDALLTMVRS
jgi:HAD superfamily hydrolase (TIGR01549 family)